MKNWLNSLCCVLALVLSLNFTSAAADSLERGFSNPPPDSRPWVYWFWLNGNISSNGITADLEAMKRVGIGGVLIMEVDQGSAGRAGRRSWETAWRGLFQHVVAEARRLGLEVNMNNDAGWNGSGGPWIKPEQSMQKVVWTRDQRVRAASRFEGMLPQPQIKADYYRDIAVLAFPTIGPYRIDRIKAKALLRGRLHRRHCGPKELASEMVIPRNRIVNLTSQMGTDGHLSWDVPAGDWTIFRLGTPAPASRMPPPPRPAGVSSATSSARTVSRRISTG